MELYQDDIALMDAARSGSHTAFESLVKKYQGTVATTAMGMLGDMNEAEEIGQQVFIRLYKNLDQYRGEAKLKTYLTRITINLCLNHLKRTQKMDKRNVDIEHAGQVRSDSELNANEDKEVINNALMKLSENHRAVITLRMIQGYDTLQTAELLKLPKGTVLSRLKRGMERLKEVLTVDFKYEYR